MTCVTSRALPPSYLPDPHVVNAPFGRRQGAP